MCIKTSFLLILFTHLFVCNFPAFFSAFWPFSPLGRQHVHFILRSPDLASSSMFSPSVPLTLPLVPLSILKWHLLATQAAGCLQLHSVIWSLPCLEWGPFIRVRGGRGKGHQHTDNTQTYTHHKWLCDSMRSKSKGKVYVVLWPMQV